MAALKAAATKYITVSRRENTSLGTKCGVPTALYSIHV